MSEPDQREDELRWFGVTVALSARRVPYGPDGVLLVPAEVHFDTSHASDAVKTGVTFLVMPEEGETDMQTRERALDEARELADLFRRLTAPVSERTPRCAED